MLVYGRPPEVATVEDAQITADLRFYLLSVENSPFGKPVKETLEQAEKEIGPKPSQAALVKWVEQVYHDVRKQETDLMETGKEKLVPEVEKVIPLTELPAYLNDMWRFVAKLSDSEVVVRK